MKYTLRSSLQRVALIKIAVQMWNQVDIRNLITNFEIVKDLMHSPQKIWNKIEDQVLNNVSHLLSPEPLKKDLRGIIRPIGYHIKAWCSYHREECPNLKLPDHFCWTPEGTIDRKKTAQMLIKDEDINLDLRYELSCINCLEDKIPELWNRISEQQKQSYFINQKVQNLVQFWTYHLFGDASELEQIIRIKVGQIDPPHVYALRCAVEGGNLTATKFFFGKLNSKEREEILMEQANRTVCFLKPKKCHSEILYFLLSQLSDDQQSRVLENYPHCVLSCFLDWPYQPLFMVFTERVMRVISEEECMSIVFIIIFKMMDGWTDFDYQQLLYHFCDLIPLDYKRRTIKNIITVSKLLQWADENVLTSIFSHADALDKERLILSREGQNLCRLLIFKNKWGSLEVFIEQCVPSKEVMVQFKEGYMERYRKSGIVENEDEIKWKTFCRLLDTVMIGKNGKRKTKVDENEPSKNLCTE